jgi:hypothetical protein
MELHIPTGSCSLYFQVRRQSGLFIIAIITIYMRCDDEELLPHHGQ